MLEPIKIYSDNKFKYVAVDSNGTFFIWSKDSEEYTPRFKNLPIIKIYTNIGGRRKTFSAIYQDGSVITWGDKEYGGDSNAVTQQLDGTIPVIKIHSSSSAFAALREDGSVVTWGHNENGGDSSEVAQQLDGTIPVIKLYSSRSTIFISSAFAALRQDGSVVTWGYNAYGDDSSNFVGKLDGSMSVIKIYSTNHAFAALRGDGSVVTWGDKEYGGDSSEVAQHLDGSISVIQIFSTNCAFAALREDGSVVTWGHQEYGGDSSEVAQHLDGSISVIQIFSTNSVFAALRKDGSLITWRDIIQLDDSIPVKKIYSSSSDFAVLREDGSLITWADTHELDDCIFVKQIASTNNNYNEVDVFAVLRQNGSVILLDNENILNISEFNSLLGGTVPGTQIYSSPDGIISFAVLREDDSLVYISCKIINVDNNCGHSRGDWSCETLLFIDHNDYEHIFRMDYQIKNLNQTLENQRILFRVKKGYMEKVAELALEHVSLTRCLTADEWLDIDHYTAIQLIEKCYVVTAVENPRYSDIRKAINEGNQFVDRFYNFYNGYIEEIEKIESREDDDLYKITVGNFDIWLNGVVSDYSSKILDPNFRNLGYLNLQSKYLRAFYALTRHMKHITIYWKLCGSYCIQAPILFPFKRQ